MLNKAQNNLSCHLSTVHIVFLQFVKNAVSKYLSFEWNLWNIFLGPVRTSWSAFIRLSVCICNTYMSSLINHPRMVSDKLYHTSSLERGRGPSVSINPQQKISTNELHCDAWGGRKRWRDEGEGGGKRGEEPKNSSRTFLGSIRVLNTGIFINSPTLLVGVKKWNLHLRIL